MFSSREVEYIIAISQTQNITKAAQICHVSQPALTIQLNTIENKLGFKVFERERGKVTLTTRGRKVLSICNEIYKKFEDLKNIRTIKPKINVGIIPTVSHYLLPNICHKLNKTKVDMYFYELKTADLICKVQNGEIDYGVLAYYKNIVPKTLQYTKIYEEELLFASHKSSNVNIKDVVDDIILLDDGNCLNFSISKICKMQKVKHNFTATSIEVVKAMILNNNGYGILPKYSLHNEEVSFFNLKSFKPIATREVGIVCKDNEYLSLLIKTLTSL